MEKVNLKLNVMELLFSLGFDDSKGTDYLKEALIIAVK